MRRGVALVLLLLAAGCGGGGGGAAEQPGDAVDDRKPMLAADGPLGGVVMAAKRPVAPSEAPAARAWFPSTHEQVHAVVGVAPGLESDARIRVAWYRLTADGRRELFAHEVDVGRGGGRVVSQAVARAGLAPGIYETVATLGERQVRTPWFVRAGAGGRTLSAAGEAPSAEPADPAAGTVDWQAVADWHASSEGGGGAYTDDWDEPPSPPGACSVLELSPFAFMLWLDATLAFRGEDCSTVTIAAAGRGAPRTYASLADPPPTHWTSLGMKELLCELPGGSDLPGAVIRVVGSANAEREEVELTLERVPEAFDVGIESMPEPGSRVEAGDTINLRAIAADLPPSYGIKVLYVDDGSELLGTTPSIGGASEPRACDHLRFVALLGDWPAPAGARSAFEPLRYRVPDDAPPVIELCAQGETFDGRSKTSCAEYYTGEVWEGTMVHDVTTVPASAAGPCGVTARLNGTVRIVVQPDGTARGAYDVEGCLVSEPHGEWTGRATEEAFHFPQLIVQTNGEPIPKVSPTEARATLTNFQGQRGVGGAEWVTTWNLRCVSC